MRSFVEARSRMRAVALLSPLRMRTSAPAWILLAAALVTAPTASSAPTITSVDVSKGIGYVQTSATGVAVVAAGAYSFDVGVRGTGLASLSPAPTISGPIDAALVGPSFDNGTLTYSTQESAWVFHGQYASAAERDARFGNGTYTLTVGGTAVPLKVTGDAYPNAPMVSFSQGEWVNGKFHFDPSRPLTITTNAFTGYSPKGGIMLGWGIGSAGQLQVDNPSNSMSVTVPANSFAAGQEFNGYAQFGAAVDEYHGTFYGAGGYRAFTGFVLVAQAPSPVFPMTVTSNITATTASVQATIQARPQDAGTTQSIFVFLVAPSTLVQGAALAKEARLGVAPKGAKDGATQCVLAQADSLGQLHAVTPSTLQPYASGVLGAQGQAVSVLNNIPTANVAGATAFVGYGPNAQTMYDTGINQSAATIPGNVTCKPETPQTGWWWNPQEDGRGYSLEVNGNRYFFASFLYDATGRATWVVSTGQGATLDGSIITGDLLEAHNGQTLGGAYPGSPRLSTVGRIALAFSDAQHGTLIWPGGAVPIQRFNIVPNGLTLPPLASQPESGWWWNPDESGRGFFMEWQGGVLDMAGYMYDDNGNPLWLLTENLTPSTNLQQFSSSWWQFADGMTLAGPWKPNRQVSGNVAPVTIQFSGPDTALMTLPNGRTTQLVRQRF